MSKVTNRVKAAALQNSLKDIFPDYLKEYLSGDGGDTITVTVPAQTIWLKVDGNGDFSFKPEELGIEGDYDYLLTYYAEPENMDDVGAAIVTNSFEIWGKTYVNQAAIWDEINSQPVDMESADVTITRIIGKFLDEEAIKALGGSVNGNMINGTLNRIPFKIEINPLGEDMCEGSVLPALIDELSDFLRLVEDAGGRFGI